MGIRAPSLYKHVRSKDDLEALLMAEAFRGMGAELHGAIAGAREAGSKTTALAELGRAYRRWALAHPHLYRLVTAGPLPKSGSPRASRRGRPSRSSWPWVAIEIEPSRRGRSRTA